MSRRVGNCPPRRSGSPDPDTQYTLRGYDVYVMQMFRRGRETPTYAMWRGALIVKPLMSVATVLLFLIAAVAIHYTTSDHDRLLQSQQALTSLTGLDDLAYGAAWTALRLLRRQARTHNPAYPELDPIIRSDFVYAQ